MFQNLKQLAFYWKSIGNTGEDYLWKANAIILFIKNWLSDNSDNYRDLEELLELIDSDSEFVEWVKKELDLDE